MAKMRVTKEDLLKSKPIEPAWYPAEVTSYEQKPAGKDAKNPGSLNTTFKFKLLEGAVSPTNKDMAGAIVYRLFNEAGMGFAAPFIAVVRDVLEVDPEGVEFDPDEAKGKKMLVYIQNRMYEGRMQNEVADFRPIV